MPSAATSRRNAAFLFCRWRFAFRAWRTRPLADRDCVYVWADGVHFNVRLEDERIAALVVIGARPDGTKEVVALEDGYRESTESWLTLLRDLKERGMRAPVVAVGDGALGFWATIREELPKTREERCWVHKIANVLDKLPKSLQRKAKAALHEMINAPTDDQPSRVHLRHGEAAPARHQGLRLARRRTVSPGDFQKGTAMELEKLSEEQAQLWSRVDALWKLSLTRNTAPVRDALHPNYTGWVTGQPEPHDRDAAVASVGPSSPRVVNYRLTPLRITSFDGIVGVVHYSYVAEVEAGAETKSVSGRWSEVYLRKNGEWIMISVCGGPDGQR